MKITVIGGGSTYTPELIDGFLKRADRLDISELVLMDTDSQRLDIVGGFAQRMAAAKGNPFKISLSTNQREAIQGSAYVVTQLRIGQMPARVADEYLGQRHGLIGQETTGIGGMAKALRTIPVILDIARDIRQTAPNALLVNFTNPSGLVTEALQRYAPDVHAVGVCNAGITMKMEILKRIEQHLSVKIDPRRAVLQTLGLNHLTWYRGFTVEGEDLWPQIFPIFLDELRHAKDPEWDVSTIEAIGMIPNYYLQYFYHTDKKLGIQNHWPPSRGEEVLTIEKGLLETYAAPYRTEPPEDLLLRGGAFYSTLATELIESHNNNAGYVEIVNVKNNGAIREWPADWVLELPCKIDRGGVHPIPAAPLPQFCYGLIAHVKSYEILTVEAAVHGDRCAAYQALLTHPLGPQGHHVQEVLDDMLKTHRAYLPKFYPED